MRDQVLNLQQAGIHAEVLSSATSKEDTKRISDILNGKVASESLKFIYVTPEKVRIIIWSVDESNMVDCKKQTVHRISREDVCSWSLVCYCH